MTHAAWSFQRILVSEAEAEILAEVLAQTTLSLLAFVD